MCGLVHYQLEPVLMGFLGPKTEGLERWMKQPHSSHSKEAAGVQGFGGQLPASLPGMRAAGRGRQRDVQLQRCQWHPQLRQQRPAPKGDRLLAACQASSDSC